MKAGDTQLIGPLCPTPFLVWSLLTPPVHRGLKSCTDEGRPLRSIEDEDGVNQFREREDWGRLWRALRICCNRCFKSSTELSLGNRTHCTRHGTAHLPSSGFESPNNLLALLGVTGRFERHLLRDLFSRTNRKPLRHSPHVCLLLTATHETSESRTSQDLFVLLSWPPRSCPCAQAPSGMMKSDGNFS